MRGKKSDLAEKPSPWTGRTRSFSLQSRLEYIVRPSVRLFVSDAPYLFLVPSHSATFGFPRFFPDHQVSLGYENFLGYSSSPQVSGFSGLSRFALNFSGIAEAHEVVSDFLDRFFGLPRHVANKLTVWRSVRPTILPTFNAATESISARSVVERFSADRSREQWGVVRIANIFSRIRNGLQLKSTKRKRPGTKESRKLSLRLSLASAPASFLPLRGK